MVDAERLHRILRRIGDDLALLRHYATQRTELRADAARLGHVKYLFVTAIECCLDAAHHVLAAESWAVPESNADAVRLLARHGVLDAELGERLAAAVGFRNVLVHGYADVDDERVIANLDRLNDLDAFIDAVSGLLADQLGG